MWWVLVWPGEWSGVGLDLHLSRFSRACISPSSWPALDTATCHNMIVINEMTTIQNLKAHLLHLLPINTSWAHSIPKVSCQPPEVAKSCQTSSQLANNHHIANWRHLHRRLSRLDSKSEHLAERQGDPHPVILPPWQERIIFVGTQNTLDDNDDDRSLQQPCFKRGNIPKLASHQLNKYKSDKSWQLTPCWTFLRIILIEWFRAQKGFCSSSPIPRSSSIRTVGVEVVALICSFSLH